VDWVFEDEYEDDKTLKRSSSSSSSSSYSSSAVVHLPSDLKPMSYELSAISYACPVKLFEENERSVFNRGAICPLAAAKLAKAKTGTQS
jgi:hypothetical protein